MIGLPHLMLLQYIKRQMRFIRANPEYIYHALEGYSINEDVRSIFGSKRIDDGILWFQQNEFSYTPRYNLDSLKLPNITVSYEGGTEDVKFLGDFGGECINGKQVPPKVYLKDLIFKGVTDERTHVEKRSDNSPAIPPYGYPVVSASVNVRDKVWRQLKLIKEAGGGGGNDSYVISGFRTADNGVDTVLITDRFMSVNTGEWQGKWSVVSSLSGVNYILNSSLDAVRIKVNLLVPADPEVTEMVGCVLKYVLKNSRLWLSNNGFQVPSVSHSSIGLIDGLDNPTWGIEFSVTGKLTDTWISTPLYGLDRLNISIEVGGSTESSSSVESDEVGSEVDTSSPAFLTAPEPVKQTPHVLFGVASANNSARADRYMTDLNNFESYVNTKHDLFLYFTQFDTRDTSPDMITPYFYTYPLSMWNAGKIPVLTWYPSTSNVTPTPANITTLIANGTYDAYLNKCLTKINQFLTDARANPVMGTPKIYLRLAHEMNINTHAWSGPTPSDFISMWRHITTLAQSYPKITKDSLQWVWCPNNNDISTPAFENYYPGDQYVDWVGLDGYNWRGFSATQTFEQVFEPSLKRLQVIAPSKPVMIAEYGVAPRVKLLYDIKGKAKWVRDSFFTLSGGIIPNSPPNATPFIQTYNIKAAMYYNISLSPSDIDSGIFIAENLVLDPNSLDTWYTSPSGLRYRTFSTIQNDYGRYYQIGFNNAGVNITGEVFKGNYPNT